MSNILAHIVGMDDLMKIEFIKSLPANLIVLDLDNLQQRIYNNKDITDMKAEWSRVNQEINVLNSQKRFFVQNGGNVENLLIDVKDRMKERAEIKSNIYSLWKETMKNQIESFISKQNKSIICIGFNIYAKDYRQRVNLPIDSYNATIQDKHYFNNIIVDTSANYFASNQITYYLDKYRQKIIAGSFPLYLLDREYLKTKYEKFITYYANQGYDSLILNPDSDAVSENVKSLIQYIADIEKQMNTRDKQIFYASLFKVHDTVPVSKAIEGYPTRDAALHAIKVHMKKKSPIFLYELKGDTFRNIDGKYFAFKAPEIIKEETLFEESSAVDDTTIDKLLNAMTTT